MIFNNFSETEIFSIPKFVVEKTDVEGFMDELRDFIAPFRVALRVAKLARISFITWLDNSANWTGNR